MTVIGIIHFYMNLYIYNNYLGLKNTYDSFYYTSLVYLNSHQLDYYGGRFVFKNLDNHRTSLSIEPKTARVLLFTSGAENEHYVEPVISGTRYALTIAFTCNQKFALARTLEDFIVE